MMNNNDIIYKDVLAFRIENTKYVIRYINNNDELLARCRKAGKDGIEEECFQWAREHNDEFGNRFILELYDVFWEKVWYGIKEKNNARTA